MCALKFFYSDGGFLTYTFMFYISDRDLDDVIPEENIQSQEMREFMDKVTPGHVLSYATGMAQIKHQQQGSENTLGLCLFMIIPEIFLGPTHVPMSCFCMLTTEQ